MGTIHQLPLFKNPSLDAVVNAVRRAPRGTHITLLGYRPSGGGLLDYTIATCSYADVARASLAAIRDLTPEVVAVCCEAADGDVDVSRQALEAVRQSWGRAVNRDPGESRGESPAPGLVRYNNRDGLYLAGLVIHRRELVAAGAPRPRKSSKKTLVRRWIEDRAPSGAWRQFKLGAHNWSELRVPRERIRNAAFTALVAA